MTTKFETKEEYLQFISAWKYATNAEEAKSKRYVCDHNQYTWNGITDEEIARLEEKGYQKKGNYLWVLPNGGHCKDSGWLHAPHYVFYNIMLGKDPMRGFSPKTDKKLTPGESPWQGFEEACWQLEMAVTNAHYNINCISLGKVPPRHKADRVETFLKPFNGMIKEADLLKISKDEIANARKFIRELYRKRAA